MPFPTKLVSRETRMKACYAGYFCDKHDVIFATPYVPLGYDPSEAEKLIDKSSRVLLDDALLMSVRC
jgi:hypothetical protein